MAYNELIAAAQKYFPSLQIKYKDQSPLMRLAGKLMFFNPSFMTIFLTTLGTTVYVPNEQYIRDNYPSFATVFIHECSHMYEEKKRGLLYTLGYVFPQVLSPLSLLLLLVLTWKIVVPLAVLLMLPLPAPWRMYFERKAYFVQMYADKILHDVNPYTVGQEYASWFKNGNYYWMWSFGQERQFAQEASNVAVDKPSCMDEPELFRMVEDLIAAAK